MSRLPRVEAGKDGRTWKTRPVEGIHFTRVKYNRGDTIFTEGSSAEDGFFLIEWGEVSIRHDGEHLRDMGAGAFFGEESLVGDIAKVKRDMTVFATQATEVIEIDRTQFEEHIKPILGSFASGDVEAEESTEYADSLSSEELGHLLVELLLPMVESNPKVARAAPFYAQLGIVIILVFGGHVAAVSLALESGWKPWQFCEPRSVRCNEEATEPPNMMIIFHVFSASVLIAGAALAAKYCKM